MHMSDTKPRDAPFPKHVMHGRYNMGYICLVFFGLQHSANVNNGCIFVIHIHVVHRLCNIQHDLVN
jgi:hypothetical protein